MSIVSTYPLVSIITVNYNQIKVTEEFLTSIQGITYPNIEIIVVDNGSQEPGLESLKQLFPHIILIQSQVNTGFAGGNNIGVAAAKGEYLLFINNDTEVEQDFLEPLIACMQADAAIGMVSPKIKYYHNKNIIQYAGGIQLNPFTGRGRFIGSGQPDSAIYHQTYATQLIHGAAMLVSRELIKKAGLMEEAFFLYYEELDWCERAKKAGFSLYFVGQSVVFHKVSSSVGKNSPLKIYYLTRNRLLFARRNYHGMKLCIHLLFFILITLPKNIVSYLSRGEFNLLKAFIKGVVWHIQPAKTSYNPPATKLTKQNLPIPMHK